MHHLLDVLIPLAPFILVYLIIRMKHERRLRELSLNTMSAEEQRAVAELSELARRLENRVDALERVLDSELAGWRGRMPI
jgi:phage shock protein B